MCDSGVRVHCTILIMWNRRNLTPRDYKKYLSLKETIKLVAAARRRHAPPFSAITRKPCVLFSLGVDAYYLRVRVNFSTFAAKCNIKSIHICKNTKIFGVSNINASMTQNFFTILRAKCIFALCSNTPVQSYSFSTQHPVTEPCTSMNVIQITV